MRTNADLRKMLADTICDVRNGKIDSSTANAISQLSSRILASARLDIEAARLMKEKGQEGSLAAIDLFPSEQESPQSVEQEKPGIASGDDLDRLISRETL